ncbi:hypothetical protein G4B88_012321 [Cannabis sativa]|uniref:BHLH domain-containing protein n=1 Tax=Cannabis sativa TaxID=3483 RepID=A0A7J6I5C3_CANSA|nr:hypothetical protein G4B88_012321 [Cannabis sativa]
MLAFSPPPPPLFSTNKPNNIVGWPLDDLTRFEDQNYLFSDYDQYPLLFLNTYNLHTLPPPSDQHNNHNHQRFEVDRSATPSSSTATAINSDLTMVEKKLNHNASERDRRKKVNHMYSALRSLLPPSDHTKKLSIPATVSRVLKYVPELQEEVESLVLKKEELLSKMNSMQQGKTITATTTANQEIKKVKSIAPNSLSSISATQLSEKEIAVQILSYKADNDLLSEMLHNYENEGLSLLHASSFESIGGRLFHNLHLQAEVSYCMEAELNPSLPSTTAVTGDDPTIIKKLCHNASERDRRKRINSLYSSLRSLLPAADQMKKLSNPSTISRTIKYIPELQNQVKGLIKKKEELLSSMSKRVELIYEESHKKSSLLSAWRSLCNVSVSRLNDSEIVLQISCFKVQQTPLSHILIDLEEDGFSVLNVNSFESLKNVP